MLYELLYPLRDQFFAFNVFRYITFRSAYAAITAFLLTLLLGPWCIAKLRSLGFLWYNSHPAEVFMGDTGSLSLGGALAIVAILIKMEFILAIVGGLFVAEALSVILQVGSFRLRGKRIFKMAPLHHHFELLGWSESKVVVRFWIVAGLFALLSLSTLKLR